MRFKAYKAIKEKIIYLDFKPGEKIFENVLAKSLNVSRTPVREALLMLEHEKLVTAVTALDLSSDGSMRKTLKSTLL